jgi:hypothetical protein
VVGMAGIDGADGPGVVAGAGPGAGASPGGVGGGSPGSAGPSLWRCPPPPVVFPPFGFPGPPVPPPPGLPLPTVEVGGAGGGPQVPPCARAFETSETEPTTNATRTRASRELMRHPLASRRRVAIKMDRRGADRSQSGTRGRWRLAPIPVEVSGALRGIRPPGGGDREAPAQPIEFERTNRHARRSHGSAWFKSRSVSSGSSTMSVASSPFFPT